MTTDGAANERKAAQQLVKEGNTVACAAHTIQLAINDVTDSEKSGAPEDCQPHRSILSKAHTLVRYVNSHKKVLTKFTELVQNKPSASSDRYQTLVEDVVTRWDSELAMLERVVHFDAEIIALCSDPEMGISPDMLLNEEELDLAFGMTLVLTHLRIFTKFVQNRNIVTLAYLPKKMDDLITEISPGCFDEMMSGRSGSALPLLVKFQVRLIEAIRRRFSPIFEFGSLALEASLFLPGKDRFQFKNFELEEGVLDDVCLMVLLAHFSDQKPSSG